MIEGKGRETRISPKEFGKDESNTPLREKIGKGENFTSLLEEFSCE